jgi:hypothetical protein
MVHLHCLKAPLFQLIPRSARSRASFLEEEAFLEVHDDFAISTLSRIDDIALWEHGGLEPVIEVPVAATEDIEEISFVLYFRSHKAVFGELSVTGGCAQQNGRERHGLNWRRIKFLKIDYEFRHIDCWYQ